MFVVCSLIAIAATISAKDHSIQQYIHRLSYSVGNTHIPLPNLQKCLISVNQIWPKYIKDPTHPTQKMSVIYIVSKKDTMTACISDALLTNNYL